MKTARTIVSLGFAAALFAGALQAGEYSLQAGAEVTRGDYGTDETSTVLSFPVGIGYRGERFAWAVSVPYVVVNAPEDFVVTGGGTHGAGQGGGGSAGASSGGTRTDAGMGDAVASLSLTLAAEGEIQPWLGITGEIKFATGDEERGLGTGAEDYTLQLEGGKGWLNGRVGYRWLGDSEAVVFDDVAYGAVGVAGAVGRGSVGLEFYGEQAAQDGAEGRSEVTLYGSYPGSERVTWNWYLFKGLSDGSADVGAGVALGFAL